jgi:hypothetical protein
MKTKTLLIAAAALAAGIMSSQAQVYSQNIVGYVNVALPVGYSQIANQLDLDGTGTNNSIYTAIGTNLPSGTQILAWNGSTFTSSKLSGAGKWSANSQTFTNAVNPGSGFFINVSVATNITFVGSVITGTNTYPIVAGYQLIAPSAPVAGAIGTALGYTPTKNDQILIWNNGTGTYASHKYNGSAWSAGEPTFSVSEAVFLNAATTTNWTQVLNP